MILKDLLHSSKYNNKHILHLILKNVLNFSKEELFTRNFIEISEENIEKIDRMYFDYKNNHIPIEYILWYCEFMGEKFFVDENTLIPRPETEYLVNYALNETDNKDIIIDIWTWSWIIWIMIWKITWKDILAIDIEEKILNIAKKNAKNLKVNNITFIKSNLLENVDLKDKNKILICANLPYLEKNYKLDKLAESEPATALFAGDDWLELYRNLLNKLDKNKEYTCLFELTAKQANILIKEYNFKFYKILDTCHKNIKVLKIFVS